MSAVAPPGGPVHLVKGSDEVLLADAVRSLVDQLVGDGDRNEILQELTGDDYEPGEIVMAANTVSMFGARVVVARNCGRFNADAIAQLMQYLDSPSPDSVVVLAWDKPATPNVRSASVPKKLSDAIKAAGGSVTDASLPGGKGRGMWLDAQLDAAPVRLDGRARKLLAEQLGDDLSRLGGILVVLEATYGTGADVSSDELVPFLGDGGAVPPWELTDAIDKGQIAEAVAKLQRMLAGGARHPLQVMVSVQSHFERMLRLDGSDVRDEKDAAAMLGMKGSSYPAKKAMAQGRKLGTAKLVRATQLIAAADVDLRGATEQSAPAVMETLVGRLAALSSRPGARRR